MELEKLINKKWKNSEKKLANLFDLKIINFDEIIIEITKTIIDLSIFSIDEIKKEFDNNLNKLMIFAERWYFYCKKNLYGEEWNVEEGNQQPKNNNEKIKGISEGFFIQYIIYFLYAKYKEDFLLEYLEKTKIPYSKKVKKDILKIYKNI